MSNAKETFSAIGADIEELKRGRIDVNSMESVIEAVMLKKGNLSRIKAFIEGGSDGNEGPVDYSRYTNDGKVTLAEPYFVFDFAESSDTTYHSRGGGALIVQRNVLRDLPPTEKLKGIDVVTGKRYICAYNPMPAGSTAGVNPIVKNVDPTTKAKDSITIVMPFRLEHIYMYAVLWLAVACRYYPDENRTSTVGVTGSAFGNAINLGGNNNYDLTKFSFNRQQSTASATNELTINNKQVTMDMQFEADKWYILRIKQPWRGDISLMSAATGNGTSSARIGEGLTIYVDGESDDVTKARVTELMAEYKITG